MALADAKAVVRQWLAAWNQGDVDTVMRLVSENYVRHDANLPEVVGPDAERQFTEGILATFSGLTVDEQAMIAEGDLVAVRLEFSGRHVGEFMGIAATDRQVTFQAQELYRVEGEALAEQWVTMDFLGLLQQLGAVPAS